MAVKIIGDGNVMFIGKDKDTVLSLNSEQNALLMKRILTIFLLFSILV